MDELRLPLQRPAHPADFFVFELATLSREIEAALLNRAGGVALASAAALGLGLLPAPALSVNFTVTKLADTSDGSCSAGDCSLREAVVAANQNNNAPNVDEITFDSSVTGTIRLSDQPSLPSNVMEVTEPLAITGPGADLLTVNADTDGDGTGESRIFYVTEVNADLTVTGLTLTNGFSDVHGGAIDSGASVTLNGVVIKNSTAVSGGGGLALYHADLSMTNSTITGNTTGGCGGGFRLVGNFMRHDGYGDAIIINSTVSGNTAGSDGGGLCLSGLYANGNVTITNSTVSGNTAGDDGGGIYLGGNVALGEVTLKNSTVSGNTASDDGGGFFVGGGRDPSGDATLLNSIVANNQAAGSYDAFAVRGYGTTFVLYSLVEGTHSAFTYYHDNITGQDPVLGPLRDNGGPTQTHALQPGSPAIDAGSNDYARFLSYDQRGPGFPRVVYGVVDMGAYELQDDGCTVGHDNLVVHDTTIATDTDYVACGQITLGPDVAIVSGAALEARAGESIRIAPVFSVEQGATFAAVIDNSIAPANRAIAMSDKAAYPARAGPAAGGDAVTGAGGFFARFDAHRVGESPARESPTARDPTARTKAQSIPIPALSPLGFILLPMLILIAAGRYVRRSPLQPARPRPP